MIILLLVLIILVLMLVLLNNNERFQDFNNGYINACNEITTKRTMLRSYIRMLRAPVQDLSGYLLNGTPLKRENMDFQRLYTEKCSSNLTSECIELASVDAGIFKILPDIDTFYQNLLIGGYDIDSLLQQLNFYSDLLKCPLVNGSQATFDASDNEVDMDRDIGVVDTVSLSYQLESLSPYYLSPEVVQFLLRFLISQEQLNSLRFTSTDYINQTKSIMNNIKPYYT